MRSSRAAAWLAVFACVLVPACPARAQGDCENSFLQHGDVVVATGAQAGRDTTFSDTLHLVHTTPETTIVFLGSGRTRLTLTSRRFESRVRADLSLYTSGGAREEYRIEGLPAGTPVAFRVRMAGSTEQAYDGYCGGSGCTPVTRMAVWGEGPEERVEYVFSRTYPGGSDAFDRSMTLVRPAGAPFTLEFAVAAGTSHTSSSASIAGEVRFEDLPPGAVVVPCLEPDGPTRTRNPSWGALRTRYR